MPQLSLPHALFGLCMLLSMGTAFGLSRHLHAPIEGAATAHQFVLGDDVPEAFGDWKVDPSVSPLRPAGDVAAELKHIYEQLLTRTFVNHKGERIMLSIAYTGHIDSAMNIHRPETCYPAQGFEVNKIEWQKVQSPFGFIPVKRMVARVGSRVEPISYWITVGENAVSTGFRRKVAVIVNKLTGQVTDGMLIRVSSLERDTAVAYRNHDEFINAMLAVVPERDRKRFTGTL